MAKTYPEKLGEWVKLRKSPQRDKNLVAFLAVRDDVRAAVEAGYAVKTVWTNMQESKRIEFGYDTFLNYVNRLIRRSGINQASISTELNVTPSPDAGNSKSENTAIKTSKPEAPVGFTFNAAPKKEDLF